MSGTAVKQTRAQRTGDAMVRAILRSPLHFVLSGRLLILTVVGRKTGRTYANPVGYAEHDGALLIGTVAGWRRNLVPGVPVTVRLRGRDHKADAEVITDPTEAAGLYAAILRRNPVQGRFAGVGVETDGSPNAEDLRRALAADLAVVRLRVRR
jgi:deazaflavin-dependent oxidoreductase (nitroreductase family)